MRIPELERMCLRTLMDGGASLWADTLQEVQESEGFIVAAHSKEWESRLPVAKWHAYGLMSLRRTLELAEPNHILGTWIDEDIVYVDISELVQDRDEAMALGLERQQLAIWDITHNEAIATGWAE